MRVCIIGKSAQSAEDRRTQAENLESVLPNTDSVVEDEGARKEIGDQLQSALSLIKSGNVDSICFRSHEVLGLTQEDLPEFEKVLSESGIGLSVTESEYQVADGDGDHPDTHRERSESRGDNPRQDDSDHQGGGECTNQVERS